MPHGVMVSTADFESARGGSNPSGATKVLYGVMVAYQISVLASHRLQNASIAQLAEQLTFNERVVGSNPTWSTKT